MKATSILSHEQSFFNNGIDSGLKKHIITPSSDSHEGNVLNFFDCRRENGDNSFYFKEIFPKTNIVIHYTAGYLKGDIDTLSKPNHEVSVPFVIARSGRILKLWDPKFWSYHLGPNASGGNTVMSKRTIGIEISNIGFLKKIGNGLFSDYNNDAMYCGLDEVSFYQSLAIPYRDKKFYATFTSSQYDSLIQLLRYLCSKFNINKNFLPETERYKLLTNSQATDFKGINSHVNFRKDKFDIGLLLIGIE